MLTVWTYMTVKRQNAEHLPINNPATNYNAADEDSSPSTKTYFRFTFLWFSTRYLSFFIIFVEFWNIIIDNLVFSVLHFGICETGAARQTSSFRAFAGTGNTLGDSVEAS